MYFLPLPVDQVIEPLAVSGWLDFAFEDVPDINIGAVLILVDRIFDGDRASTHRCATENTAGIAVNNDGPLLEIAGRFAFHARVAAGGSRRSGVPLRFAVADELADGFLGI